MKHLFVLFAATVVLISCQADNPVSQEKDIDASTYIPSSTGNTWTLFSGSFGGRQTELVVVGDTLWNENTYVVVEGKYKDIQTETDFEMYYFIREDKDGRIELVKRNSFMASAEDGFTRLLLDSQQDDGQQYTQGDITITVNHHERYITPAGTFDNCIDFHIDYEPAADEEYGIVFAPDIGFVSFHFAHNITYDLKSYSIK